MLGNDAELAEAIIARRDDPVLRMDGHDDVQQRHRRARQTPPATRSSSPDSTLDDVDLFVYHQANARITKAVAERLELPMERVADYIGDIGNTSAASIPLALAFARDEDRLHPGDTVLLAAVGAGFTWGGAVIEWGGPA